MLTRNVGCKGIDDGCEALAAVRGSVILVVPECPVEA